MWLRALMNRVRALWQAEAINHEIDEELQFHIEMCTEENIRRGMTPAEAEQDARRRFGHLTRIKELGYEVRGGGWLESFWQDIRYGVRMLLRKPGFTFVAVLTLALGIGANTAIFSMVNAVLLRPLPFREPERIMTLWENNLKDGIERDDVSPANFLDWRERSSSVFEEMAFANPNSLDYLGGGEPETWQAALVSEGFFRILGASALYGRTFLPEEYHAGRNSVVVLSYGLWQRRFGGDPAIINQKLVLDNQPMTVVGVMPPEFKLNLFEREKVLWAPQVLSEDLRQQRRATYLKVLARLKPAVSPEQARAEMDGIALRLAAEYPQTNAGVGVTTLPLNEQMTGQVRPALLVLLGAVMLVLLIACANVANLLLARGSERERELAVRAALGAARSRLVRQLLTESLLLALLGCASGLLLSAWVSGLVVKLSPDNIPRIEQAGLDQATLIFVSGISFLTALVFGVVPALRFSKPDLNHCLKETGRVDGGGRSRHRLRSTLVVAEIALALVLLIGAGLLLRSFVSLLRVDPGFAADKVVALQVFIWDRYATPEQRAAYAEQALEKLKTVPGVETAGITTALPFLESSADTSVPFTIEGRPAPAAGAEPTVFYSVATADYFAAVGVPLLRGRLFNQHDRMDTPAVVLINETMRRRYWPDEDPTGKKINVRGGQRGQRGPSVFEIVGVVGDVRHQRLDEESRAEFFRPHAQSPNGSIIFAVRTAVDPAALIPTLKARLWEVNRTQPIYAVATGEALISDSLKARRFSLLLLGSFAVLALVLAVIGIYGVMSFATRQRTHEIGIRMALGATPRHVLRLVIGQGMWLALVGIALGLVAAFALTRVMSSLLYGVSATDPLTYASLSLVLGGVALAACYLPARRATRVDPLVALRYE
ncbi:MAG TPA: ABC transporter permease [Pyrinomonadaceae bacterium]|nr:ABC transporter permease [Pyrinomonadaceae bacterium]